MSVYWSEDVVLESHQKGRKMTVYGVVGNRMGWEYYEIKRELDKHEISQEDQIVSGGASGVDRYAEMYAEEIGCEMTVCLPDPSKPIPEKYFDRNKKIAESCDVLIAFDKKEGGSGTKNTIKHAMELDKEVHIIT